jgi:predicted heme/steroid binding protein
MWAEFNLAHDFSLLYCEDQQEFFFYIKRARELGLLESTTSTGLRLTYSGWNRLKELSKTSIKSKQAFVAMWFDASLDSAWNDGFKPALKSCGFDPMRVDLEEHNEKICDRIISEIRRSGLVVADFTGQRGGVYFESGFAMGLGIPVVRSCHKDDISTLHFDTRQYNHVAWETPSELKEKLENRIRAMIPRIDAAI